MCHTICVMFSIVPYNEDCMVHSILLSLCFQENNPINASQSYSEQSWHGIEEPTESDSHSAGLSGRARLPVETIESGSTDEKSHSRLLNARLDVSVSLSHKFASKSDIYRVGQKSQPQLIYQCIASYVRKALLFCMYTN